MTVTVKAAVWLVAETAVTVIVLVPGGVPMTGFLIGLPPPPQLTMANAKPMPARMRQRRLTFPVAWKLPASRSPNTIPSDHARVPGRRRATGTATELGAVVLMVRVVEAGPPFGVTVAGENVQLEAAGNPLHEKLTAELMPFTGFTVMVNMEDWPALIVAVVGDAETVKSPPALPTTMVTLAVLGARTASPGYSAEIV